MMMMPSIFGENLFDDFMDFPFEREFFGRKNPLYGKNEKNMMKTDVKELDHAYELDIDLPGFKKDEVKVSLEDGYLVIRAQKNIEKKENEKASERYIRRERYQGACERSFYVGEDIKEEDVKGEFKHGLLTVIIPKEEKKPAVETKKYIEIQ